MPSTLESQPHVLALADCANCRQPFTFNPNQVPSVRVDGVRVPICRECITAANDTRRKSGLPVFTISEDAYEPLPEHAL